MLRAGQAHPGRHRSADPTRELTIRQGAITHPDWKVGAWNWREITAIDLFDVDKPLGEFSGGRWSASSSRDITIEKPHGEVRTPRRGRV